MGKFKPKFDSADTARTDAADRIAELNQYVDQLDQYVEQLEKYALGVSRKLTSVVAPLGGSEMFGKEIRRPDGTSVMYEVDLQWIDKRIFDNSERDARVLTFRSANELALRTQTQKMEAALLLVRSIISEEVQTGFVSDDEKDWANHLFASQAVTYEALPLAAKFKERKDRRERLEQAR